MSRLLTTALLALAVSAITVLPASADEGGSCPGLDSGVVAPLDAAQALTVDAPSGLVITTYCVTSGSVEPDDGPIMMAVDPGVPTLLISHPSGKPITGWSVTYDLAPAPEAVPATDPAEPVPAGFEPAAVVEGAPPAAPQEPAAPTAAGGADPAAGLRAPAATRESTSAARPPADVPVAPVDVPVAPTTDGAAQQRAVSTSTRLTVATSTMHVGSTATDARVSDRSRASATADVTARRAGLAGTGNPAETVAALIVLGLLGSAAGAVHVARRQPAAG